MINNAVLVGNLVKDPELRFVAGSGKAMCRMSIAVSRPKNKDKTDFINIVVWGKTAENCSQYLSKGSKIGVEGSYQTGSYTKEDGTKVYTNDVLAHSVEFLNTKKSDTQTDNGYQAIEEDDDVPF